jgi:hypothetical protein
MGDKTSIYIPDDMKPLLQKYTKRYGSIRLAVINTMQSIDIMYRIERRVLKALFTQQEINLMLNNAISTAYIPQSIPGAVLGDTEDENDCNFEYFGVDRENILKKLRSLTLSQQFALVDLLIELRGNSAKETEYV